MSGLLSKIGTIVSANLHSGTDAVANWNSPAMLEQHVRDLAVSHQKNASALSDATYNYNTAKSHLDADDATQEATKNNIKILMTANGGNPTDAQKAEATRLVNGLRVLMDGREAEVAKVAQLQSVMNKMQDVVNEIIEQETKTKARVQELKSLATMSKSMDAATKAIQSANEASSAMGDSSEIEEKIRMQNNRSTDAFNAALGAMSPSARPSELDKMKNDDLMASILGTSAPKAAAG